MIGGSRPFSGAYEQAVIYTILNEDPESLTGIRKGVPMELDRVVNKCMSKDASLRCQHADDLIADLRAIDQTDLSASGHSTVVSKSSPIPKEVTTQIQRYVFPVALLAILLTIVIIWIMNLGSSTQELNITDIDLVSVEEEQVAFPTIHPGGEIVAYTVKEEGTEHINTVN